MTNRTHLRNAGIASLVVVLVLLLAMVQAPIAAAPAEVLAQQALDFSWTVPSGTVTGQAGDTNLQFTANLRNNGPEGAFVITTNEPANWPDVVVSPNSQIVIPANQTQSFTFFITIPAGTAPGNYTIDITAARQTSPTTTALLRLTVTVQAPTATPTRTTAPTGSPTLTTTPGPVCADRFEPDNTPGSATQLDVQTSQLHTICLPGGAGDEDWYTFGGIGGKVYTIDITRMDPGIDLSLELFDSELRSIAFNDDFFNRDPGNPNPADIRPRITIRIPADGRYYIRARDVAGASGTNYFYVIALIDESYGPTPTTVASVCQDLFEPDGLPEQARLLTSNELQENRSICPTGDADWVTFFGRAGKRYVIFTDTRRYRGRNQVNGETQAGADTVIVLTDRDGVSLIDINDDIPGGNTLDSQIEFTPEVDGFYFLQVKNVGDIGNQFIRYDLTLLLCLPGQTDCGRASAAAPPAQSTAPQTTPQPTGTAIEELPLDDPTPTATPDDDARGPGSRAAAAGPGV